ncbi:MAG: stage II sporulation protein M [Bacillota bacterium]|jgi:stage II sporulation protein M
MISLQLQLLIRNYFKERFFLVALVVILFVMGLIFGVLGAGVLESAQKSDLLNYLDQGLHGEVLLRDHHYTRQVIIANIQTVFFLFFMGISVIGLPLALLLIFTRGFVLGFSGGFLFQNMGAKGTVLAVVGILPHNLLVIPGLMLMVVAMIDCATALTKLRLTTKRVVIGAELVRCALVTLVVIIILTLGGLVQGYLTPLFTAWLARLI